MVNITWIGNDGDWNDPTNWSTGSVPSPDDVAIISATDSATIEGSAFIGSILMSGANLTISGNLASDGENPASIEDRPGATGTLAVDAWGGVVLDSLELESSFLDDTGSLLTTSATIGDGVVNGPGAQWISSSATLTGALAVQNGGALFGDFVLSNNSTLMVDSASALSNGTITANGSALLDLVPTFGTTSAVREIDDNLVVTSGSTLTLQAASNQTVYLNGSESGPGEVNLVNVSLAFSHMASVAVQSQRTLLAAQGQTNSYFRVDHSELDFRNESFPSTSENIVQSQGSDDTIWGGSRSLWVNAVVSAVLDITLATGAATVLGASGTLSVNGGVGDLLVYDVNSADTIAGGTGNNTLVGGNGSEITAVGSGNNVIGTNSGCAYLDAQATTSDTKLFSGSGNGTSTMLGGSGNNVFASGGSALNVVCGAGNDSVWAGVAVTATIVGGSGNDVIQGSQSAFITVSGSGADVVVSGKNDSIVDATKQTGSLLVFSDNTAQVRVNAGTGKVLAVVASSTLDLSGGGKGTEVWCLDRASVNLSGNSAATVVVAGSDDTVTAASNTGTSIIAFAGGSNCLVQLDGGSNEVVCSSADAQIQVDGGHDTIFAASGHLSLDFASANLGDTSSVVLGFNPALDTLNFGGVQTSESQGQYGTEINFGSGSVFLYDYSPPAPPFH